MDPLFRDYSPAELAALRLDGEVFWIYGAPLPIDEPDTPFNRARTALAYCPPRLVVDRLSAAWCWGAIAHAPVHHQYAVDMASRSTKPIGVSPDLRHLRFRTGEVLRRDGVALTSPERTARDLRALPLVGSEIERYVALRVLDQIVSQAMNRLNVTNAIHVIDAVDSTNGVEHAVKVCSVTHFKDEPAQSQAVS